jgi:integrase
MSMGQKLKRVKRVGHLYERKYQTADGELRTKFYGIFTCKLKGKRRVFPLGGDLEAAKEELALKLADNVKGKDFDQTETTRQGIIFTEWAESYFESKIDPEKHAGGVDREKRSFKALEPFFGNMLLADIKRSVIMEYRAKRLREPIIRRGKAVMFDGKPKTISFPTVNRELAFLRAMLNMAEDDEIIDAAPRFTSKSGKNNLIKSEKDRKREPSVTHEQFLALCENMPRPALRVLAALYYTAMRVNEAVRLTWEMVDEKAGFIRLPAWYVKEKKKRTIRIFPEMQSILDELRAEQRRVPNTLNRVFTRNGRPIKSIRTAFEKAKTAAEIADLHLHDFRHVAITRWAAMGIPQAAIMRFAGHHSIAQNDDYTNMSEKHLIEACRGYTPVIREKPVDVDEAASY